MNIGAALGALARRAPRAQRRGRAARTCSPTSTASLARRRGRRVVLVTGLRAADAVAALLVAALMMRSGLAAAARSGRVLLEAAPARVDLDEIGHALAAQPGVVEVHDLHVWEVTSGFPALSAHVSVGPATTATRAGASSSSCSPSASGSATRRSRSRHEAMPRTCSTFAAGRARPGHAR